MSNSLDPDLAQHFVENVGPGLVPNCLQKLPADDTGRQELRVTSYLRTPDTFQYSFEIEKRDFFETLPISNYVE